MDALTAGILTYAVLMTVFYIVTTWRAGNLEGSRDFWRDAAQKSLDGWRKSEKRYDEIRATLKALESRP